MRKILAVLDRDIRSSIRDWMVFYILAAPILMALVLNALVPQVNASVLNVAVLQGSGGLESYLSQYGVVTTVADEQALEERVLRMDDVLGVLEKDGAYEIIRQGNEVGDPAASLTLLLNQRESQPIQAPASVTFSDVGWLMSPLKLQGGNLLILLTTVLGGMLIVLSIVEEKMSNTLSAMNVTAMSRAQFVIGKSILGFAMPVVGAFCVVWILGFPGLHFGQFAVTVLCISLLSVIIGFSIGVVNDQPISAIASMKTVFVPMLASVFGAIYLPAKWLPVLWWSPFYWAYDSVHALLLQQASWGQVLLNGVIILFLTALVFLALGKRIRQGLR